MLSVFHCVQCSLLSTSDLVSNGRISEIQSRVKPPSERLKDHTSRGTVIIAPLPSYIVNVLYNRGALYWCSIIFIVFWRLWQTVTRYSVSTVGREPGLTWIWHGWTDQRCGDDCNINVIDNDKNNAALAYWCCIILHFSFKWNDSVFGVSPPSRRVRDSSAVLSSSCFGSGF